jgi:hypothetical protein
MTVFLKTELYVVYIKAIANKGPKETAIDAFIIAEDDGMPSMPFIPPSSSSQSSSSSPSFPT